MNAPTPASLDVMIHEVQQHARSHAPTPAPLNATCWCTCGTCVIVVCSVCLWPLVFLHGDCKHVVTHREFIYRVMDGTYPWGGPT
jgi:hypothetical protein